MTCDFSSFSTVVKSYQDNGEMIMKSCLQWRPIYGWEEFVSSRAQTRDHLISRPVLNPMSYGSSNKIGIFDFVHELQMERYFLKFYISKNVKYHKITA